VEKNLSKMGIFWVESPPKHASVGLADFGKVFLHSGETMPYFYTPKGDMSDQ
jgi:hypothetical protein